MKNKVLIISGTPIISGAEYVLGDYLNSTNNINNISILHSDIEHVEKYYDSFKFENHYKSKYLNPVGVVGNSKIHIIKKVLNLLLSFNVFFKIYKDKNIKVVLGNNTGDTIYSIFSYIFKKKHINYIHDMIEPNTIIAKSILFFDRFIYRYIAVSKAVKQALISIGIDENKIIVIYNGLVSKNEYKIKNIKDEIIFGFVGNIDEDKNPLEFLDFIEIAQKQLNKKVLGKMVFGNVLDNRLFLKIQDKIKRKSLNIELLGRIDKKNMMSFYESIHFLVLTSKKDSLPTVILESFNCGVPVIASNVDGVPEIVKDKTNGYLYTDKKEFVKIVDRLNDNYRQMQMNAKNTIKNKFSNQIKTNKLDKELF